MKKLHTLALAAGLALGATAGAQTAATPSAAPAKAAKKAAPAKPALVVEPRVLELLKATSARLAAARPSP